jgi:GTP-binding protein HflX
MGRGETGLRLTRERCFLVGAIVPGRYDAFEEPLGELAGLVETAGAEVVGTITQKLARPHARTFLGEGKLEELAERLAAAGADTVVADESLTPVQLRHLERACRRKVIDRSEVILDIFNARARTAQARLQVELAQLEYELPRLARKWTHLERLGGGIGTRGPGESQIETDRRLIRRKIAALAAKLERIARRKSREVRARDEQFTACLVGYTNAGKSTILNALTGADAFVEDRVFATLDTLTRRCAFEDGVSLLLSDTVGFIRRIPHHLVASFHATLEEAAHADLLLHVIDAADPVAARYVESVDDTLRLLDLENVPRIQLFNKLDAVGDRAELESLMARVRPAIALSARTGEGLEEVRRVLHDRAAASRNEVTIRFDCSDGKRLAAANAVGVVKETRYNGNDIILRLSLEPRDLERLKRLPGPMAVERETTRTHGAVTDG